jgi:hypothetical protein
LLVNSNLPDKPDVGFENGGLAVPSGDLMEIFDRVISKVIELLRQQINDVEQNRPGFARKTIFMVGGFGSNRLLHQRGKDEFPDVNVIQPPDS